MDSSRSNDMSGLFQDDSLNCQNQPVSLLYRYAFLRQLSVYNGLILTALAACPAIAGMVITVKCSVNWSNVCTTLHQHSFQRGHYGCNRPNFSLVSPPPHPPAGPYSAGGQCKASSAKIVQSYTLAHIFLGLHSLFDSADRLCRPGLRTENPIGIASLTTLDKE